MANLCHYLLTDMEMGDFIDLESEYEYPCPDGGRTITIDIRPALKAQVLKVLAMQTAEVIDESHQNRMG